MTDQSTQLEKIIGVELESGDVEEKIGPNALRDQDSNGRGGVETPQLTPAEEMKLLRRIDVAILPYASL
jgi:hypothetical protein